MHSSLRTGLLLSLLGLPLAGISQSIPRVAGPGDANWDTRFGALPPNGQGLSPSEVATILVHASGDFIAFGNFENAGGNPDADRVARWDGSSWHPLGTGLPAYSYSAVQAPNGDIIAGMYQNSVWPDCIRRWDGTAWQMMGAGLNGDVVSLAVEPNGDILAGSSGGFAALNNASLARWNGTTWTAVASNLTRGRFIRALLALPNGDIIVGGASRNGGIGRWDGTTLHPLGSGIAGQVFDILRLPNGDLIVGGEFNNAGGNPDADYIARWDGTNWYALGTVDSERVLDLDIAANGDIIAAGVYNMATQGILRWDGTSWQTLGTGVNSFAIAVAVAPNGNIAVGGNFTACGDNSVPMQKFGIYQAHLTGTAPELTSPTATAWPNPAHTTLHVQTAAATPLHEAVSLRDASGRVVRRQPVTDGAPELTLDVTDLPRGLYWLQTGVGAGRRIVLE